MGLHTKKEFAGLCGMETKALSVYIQRKRVIVFRGKIDDSVNENYQFLLKMSDQNKDKIKDSIKGKVSVLTKGQSGLKANPEKYKKVVDGLSLGDKSDDDEDPDDPGSLYAMERQKKALDIEKIAAEIQILKLKEAKVKGEVIPTDLAKIVSIQQSKSLSTAFYNASDRLLIHVAKKTGLDRNQIADMRKGLIEIVNEAITESIEISKKALKNIVAEYSQKRGVGEKI